MDNTSSKFRNGVLSLLYIGRFEEAAREMKKALDCDSGSVQVATSDGMVSYYSRDYGQTVEKARKILQTDASFREAHLALGMALEAKHDWTAAEHEFQTVVLSSKGDSEGAVAAGASVCPDGPA